MEDKKIISVRRIMEDLVNKKNDGIWKELWMIKKMMGLGRIIQDKKIVSMRQIMEDLVDKKNDGILKELWIIKKNDGFGTIYGR